MANGNLHAGDVGTLISATFTKPDGSAFDISAATAKSISFQPPTGAAFERAAAFGTDGTNGVVTYELATGDLPTKGYWYLQGIVTFPDGDVLHSDRVRVRVYENNA